MDPAAIGKKIKELYPQYSQADDALLGQKYMQKYGGAVSGIQSGQMNIKDVPEAQRAGVSVGLQAVGYAPQEKSADSAFNASINLINELEQQFTKAKGGEYTGVGAIIGGTKKNVAGALNLDTNAKIYNKTRKGFTAGLRQLTGDVGVLTEQDYQRISNLLPKFTDDPKVATELFNTLRSQMAAKYGGEKTTTAYQQPEVKGGALAAVVPGIAQMQKTQQENLQQSLSGEMGNLEHLLRATPQGMLLQKGGLQGAGEVLSVLGLSSLAKSALGKTKLLTKQGALANRSDIAAQQSAKISGEKVYSSARQRVLKSVSETDRNAAIKMLDKAKAGLKGKSFNAQTALEKLSQYNKAYTTTGRAGKSAKAAVNDALSKAIREEIKSNMPAVFQAQEQLKTALGLGKNVRKTIGMVGLAGAGTGGLSYLVNLLTGKAK